MLNMMGGGWAVSVLWRTGVVRMEGWWLSLAVPLLGLVGLYGLLRPAGPAEEAEGLGKGRLHDFPENSVRTADITSEEQDAGHSAG